MNENKMHSILMIGQSNMAGRGNIDEVEAIKNERCFMLRNGRWQPMSSPVNPDRSIFAYYNSGVSLAESFADEYAKKFETNVGLIPCADGGTTISQWQSGGLLFDHAVMITQLAQRTSELKAIIWHQGESDCTSDELIATYQEKFMRMISELRRHFPDVPIVLGELCETIVQEWNAGNRTAKFNVQLRELAKGIDRCTVVSSEGLELKADGLHFNSASLRVFGKRYFDGYCSLV